MAAKASVCIKDCGLNGNQVQVVYGVSAGDPATGFGVSFQNAANIDFAKSTVQMALDIKTKVAQDILDRGGPSLSVANDIVIFGGPG